MLLAILLSDHCSYFVDILPTGLKSNYLYFFICLLLPDLDDSVRNGGLDRLFSDSHGRELSTVQPHHNSVFKSVTVRTNRTADGVRFYCFLY